MSGEDGNSDSEPEVHPAPDVIEFANTFVSFRVALNKALLEQDSIKLNAEQEIELFRIWYIDKTDRAILKATSLDPDDPNTDWFANDDES